MRNLNWFDKFLFLLNSLFAVALLFSYLLPYIPPQTFALLSVLSLGVPMLIILNFIFMIYWLIKLKRQALLSFVVLLLGLNHLTSVFEISGAGNEYQEGDATLNVMSYNVRQFNQFRWSDDVDIPQKIGRFIKEQDPDVLAMQEYYMGELDIALSFPHKFIFQKEESAEFGLAIFSKYPILDSGSLDFSTSSNNNAVYADILVEGDTLRVINTHLQSYTLKPNMNTLEIEKERSKRVFLGMGQTFVKQQEQIEKIYDLVSETPHRKIVILGDFNNTAFSYIYRKTRSLGFNDAYKEAGNGFGRTFDFDYFPLRIDYIFVHESMDVISFETMEVHYSDHFPIKARIKL